MQPARLRHALFSFLVIALLASPLMPAAVAAEPPHEAPDPTGGNAQSLKDGCQRDPAALIAQQTPEWVYVYNTPPDQAPPNPQWVSGVIDSYVHSFAPVHTSGADFAFGHETYDFNVNVIPDPAYTYLIGGKGPVGSPQATGNYSGSGEGTARLHTEWEDLTVPHFAWPEPGDRITEKGSWVWDCGHWGTGTNVFSPDYDLPHVGQPCPLLPGAPVSDPSQCKSTGEDTEFHPYRALFVQRQQQPDAYFINGVSPITNGTNLYKSLGDNPNSPLAENEGDVFVSTDKTPAGMTADCAHKNPPQNQNVSYPPAFTACMHTEPNWQDVSGHYDFFLPAPAKPTPDAQLVFRSVDKGSVGAPTPLLTPTAANDGVHITFDIDCSGGAGANCQPNQRLVLARQVFVGWDTVLPSQVPTHLRVTFNRLDIHRAMDPGCSRQQPVPGCENQSTRQNQAATAPGDYNIYWDVNGIWGQWPNAAPGAAPGELLPNDGDSYNNETRTVDLYVPPGKGWRLFVHGRECDIHDVDPARPLRDCPTNRELADDNDVPGLILDTYSSADAALGTHTSHALRAPADPTSTCPTTNPNGCYSVTYTVAKINDAAARVRLPDLSVAKTDSPDPVLLGHQLTYTLTAKNNGPAAAGAVSLTDHLPSGVTFNSASSSKGSCGQTGGIVTCGLGTLAPAAQATATIKVTPQQAGVITNNASIASANEPDADGTDNNTSESTTVSAQADLSLKKADAPDPVAVGGRLTYTLKVKNNGPQTATDVSLTDQLPKATRLRSGTNSQGTCAVDTAANMVTCGLGDLAGGATATVRIVVKTLQRGRITNTAIVSAASPDDPNSANNTSSATTRVVRDT